MNSTQSFRPLLSWDDAINLHCDPITMVEMSNGVVNVDRPDGSVVAIAYYPRSDFYLVRRYRKDGRLGASARYFPERDGWKKCLNYRLPEQYRTI